MKEISGYEIVIGLCADCSFNTFYRDCNVCRECKKDSYRSLLDPKSSNGKIYKKKKEKMTHDEIIEVVKAHKEEKQVQYMLDGEWMSEKIDTPIRVILNCITHGYVYRIKPEPKVIPWTYKDADEFKDIVIMIDGLLADVERWNASGIYFKNSDDKEIFMSYPSLVNQVSSKGNLCGKVVER